ncbi:1-acyl-sn-glycerol-3-phosphate acyltransferase [Bacillus shivajii]|uniref:lysophospholipid acyltransferase family protein n=1 Tax=Bacillus shivajii TaxID=1983719 RepID=UPI001CFAD542|nr:lysophospholipid acyltransferase family protein [Bacillus shivajii]UCZ54046.1 1-acyl-sn-glycerol-3-phosphate acyltransferase [Bacillus shivajii]
MFRTILWFIYFFGYLIYSLPNLWKAERLKKQGDTKAYQNHVDAITTKWAKSLIRVAGGNVHVKGKEKIPKDETLLIVCNHVGNFDIPVLLGHLGVKISFISKVEVKKIPIVRSWMKHMNCVFMNRKNKREAIQAIIDGARNLQNGQHVVIFPEGTRSKGGDVKRFKKGSFKLATKSKATILPVTMEGTHQMMEGNRNFIRPADVFVTISDPIRVHQEHDEMDLQQLAHIVQEQVESKLTKNNCKETVS